MGRRWKFELVHQLRQDAHHNRSMSLLWSAVVRRVDALDEDAIGGLASGPLAFAQPRELARPALAGLCSGFRPRQLEAKIIEITIEGGAQKTAHVFKEEGARTQFANRA